MLNAIGVPKDAFPRPLYSGGPHFHYSVIGVRMQGISFHGMKSPCCEMIHGTFFVYLGRIFLNAKYFLVFHPMIVNINEQ